MIESKNILNNALWSLSALVAPVVIVTPFVHMAQNIWQYLVGVALAEIVGVFCLTRLRSKSWIRKVCIAIYLPLSFGAVIFYTLCLVLGWPGHPRC